MKEITLDNIEDITEETLDFLSDCKGGDENEQ